jgi:hypothetical protein
MKRTIYAIICVALLAAGAASLFSMSLDPRMNRLRPAIRLEGVAINENGAEAMVGRLQQFLDMVQSRGSRAN